MPTPESSAPDPRRPKRRVTLWPTGECVRHNVQQHRKSQGLTHADLVERLKANGYTMPRSGLSEIENGGRRVTVDDLMALAVALGVTPNALLLPLEDTGRSVRATAVGEVSLADLWHWADGNRPLNDLQHQTQAKLSPAASRDFSRPVRPRLNANADDTDSEKSALEEALRDLQKAAKAIERFTGTVDFHPARDDVSMIYGDEDTDSGDD